MEDYIIREIDRIGEMLMQIARRLGLLDGDAPDYTMSDVKDEFGKAGCPVDLDTVFNGRAFTSVEPSPSEHRLLCLEVRPLVLSFTYISSLTFFQYPAKVHGIIRYVLQTR